MSIIRAVEKPPGYFLHLVRNMQPIKPHVKDKLVAKNTDSFPLPKKRLEQGKF